LIDLYTVSSQLKSDWWILLKAFQYILI
jgi:hypothetical protein